jgi:hypothetical protein
MARPFVKDDPRINRRGRPKKGEAITDILQKLLDKKDDSGKLRREKVSEKLIELAEKGDIVAIKYLVDRLDGKPKETVELENSVLDQRLREIMSDGK